MKLTYFIAFLEVRNQRMLLLNNIGNVLQRFYTIKSLLKYLFQKVFFVNFFNTAMIRCITLWLYSLGIWNETGKLYKNNFWNYGASYIELKLEFSQCRTYWVFEMYTNQQNIFIYSETWISEKPKSRSTQWGPGHLDHWTSQKIHLCYLEFLTFLTYFFDIQICGYLFQCDDRLRIQNLTTPIHGCCMRWLMEQIMHDDITAKRM